MKNGFFVMNATNNHRAFVTGHVVAVHLIHDQCLVSIRLAVASTDNFPCEDNGSEFWMVFALLTWVSILPTFLHVVVTTAGRTAIDYVSWHRACGTVSSVI